jgi:diguanylate cyclase (GGDEF)-like protein
VLREQLVPAIAGISLLALAAAALILRHGSRAMRAILDSELLARHHAEHDSLTGLANRRALATEICERLLQQEALVLLYMDLDGFKDANDVYGHAAGDMLLKEAAARIRSAAMDALVARTGGDEFAMLLAPVSEEAAYAICELILEKFRAPFAMGAYRVTLGVSIGYAASAGLPAPGQDELVRRADIAMYAAKSEGKNRWRRYAPSMDEGHVLRMRMEKDLQIAIENGDIKVLFQPIVEAGTNKVVAVEALARWSHPDHGQVPPDVFIPIAELSGLINELGRNVLRQACTEVRRYDVDLAVNLSPAQFWDRNLLASVQETLSCTGFPPHRLELEITESYLLHRPDAAADIIDGLRQLGVKIALDDFGAGFASIGYLQRLKLDRMKIDKAFIAPLAHDDSAREMLASIVGLAKAFRLEVTAEGVETDAQSALAFAAGCRRMQGWLYGRPVMLGALSLPLATSDLELGSLSET